MQDGILNSAAQIVSRMSELKGLSQDVLKSPSDIATYNSEFKDLQNQLHDLSLTKFNGVDLFSDVATTDGTAATTIANGGFETDPGGGAAFVVNKPVATNVTVAGGTSIAISKFLMRHALTFQFDTSAAGAVVAGSLASDTNYSDTKILGYLVMVHPLPHQTMLLH